MKATDVEEPKAMLAGTFSCHMKVVGWLDQAGIQTVNIPVDIVIEDFAELGL